MIRQFIALALLVFSAVITVLWDTDEASSATTAPLLGSYWSSTGGFSLKILPYHRFECTVFNGSVDGCATVFGAGDSSGDWYLEGQELVFSPWNEATEIAVSLVGAVAQPSAKGMLLRATFKPYWVDAPVAEGELYLKKHN